MQKLFILTIFIIFAILLIFNVIAKSLHSRGSPLVPDFKLTKIRQQKSITIYRATTAINKNDFHRIDLSSWAKNSVEYYITWIQCMISKLVEIKNNFIKTIFMIFWWNFIAIFFHKVRRPTDGNYEPTATLPTFLLFVKCSPPLYFFRNDEKYLTNQIPLILVFHLFLAIVTDNMVPTVHTLNPKNFINLSPYLALFFSLYTPVVFPSVALLAEVYQDKSSIWEAFRLGAMFLILWLHDFPEYWGHLCYYLLQSINHIFSIQSVMVFRSNK